MGTEQLSASELRYLPAVLVHDGGETEEFNGSTGVRLLARNSALLDCIRAFLHEDALRAQFYWQTDDQQWLSVLIDREVDSSGQVRAIAYFLRESPPFGVTSRELDVLTLIALGMSNSDIASRLFTSVRTVATHVEHLLEKTGRPNRAALAALAIERGLVRRPIPGAGHEDEDLATLNKPTLKKLHKQLARDDDRDSHRVRHFRTGKRPFIIGSTFPLNGPASADGHEMRNGSALAIAEINARGGIAGRPVRQVVLDLDIFSPDSVRRAFTELISAEVDALTSGYLFAEDVAREAVASYGAPYLHAMTSEDQVQQVREQPAQHGHIFQVCPTEVHYGVGFVRFLDELLSSGQWLPANRRLAFIETPLPSGHMANQATFEHAERSGWTIEQCDLVPALGADWDPIVEGLHRLQPAAVMIAHFLPRELAAFQRSFASNPIGSLVYAIYTPSIPQFCELTGHSAEGVLWSTVTGTYSDSIGFRFTGRYAKFFGRPPGRSQAGIAYDEVHLLAQAWAAVENPRNFSSVAAQLRRTIHRGVNGSYHLDNDGQCGLAYPDVTLDPSLGQAHLVFQIQDGHHRILSPGPYSEATYRSPPWMTSPA